MELIFLLCPLDVASKTACVCVCVFLLLLHLLPPSAYLHMRNQHTHTRLHHCGLTGWRKPARWFASACVACGAGSAPALTAARPWGCQEMCGLSSPPPPGNPGSPRGLSPSPSPWWPEAAAVGESGGCRPAEWAAVAPAVAATAGCALRGHGRGRGPIPGSIGPSLAESGGTASRRRPSEVPAGPVRRPQTRRAAGQKQCLATGHRATRSQRITQYGKNRWRVARGGRRKKRVEAISVV